MLIGATGGQTLSPEGMHFPSNALVLQGATELNSPQVVIVGGRYAKQAPPKPTRCAWHILHPRQRRGRYFEGDAGEPRQKAAGGQQGTAHADVQRSGEFQEFLASGILAAYEYRDCQRDPFMLSALNEAS